MRPAQVAQLVEHLTENQGVGGSNPPLGTMRAPRTGAREDPSSAAAIRFRRKSADRREPLEHPASHANFFRRKSYLSSTGIRPSTRTAVGLDRASIRPIRCFADRDCDQGSQPNPPVQEPRPSDRSLKKGESHVRVVGALPQRGSESHDSKPGSVAGATWSRGIPRRKPRRSRRQEVPAGEWLP